MFWSIKCQTCGENFGGANVKKLTTGEVFRICEACMIQLSTEDPDSKFITEKTGIYELPPEWEFWEDFDPIAEEFDNIDWRMW